MITLLIKRMIIVYFLFFFNNGVTTLSTDSKSPSPTSGFCNNFLFSCMSTFGSRSFLIDFLYGFNSSLMYLNLLGFVFFISSPSSKHFWAEKNWNLSSQDNKELTKDQCRHASAHELWIVNKACMRTWFRCSAKYCAIWQNCSARILELFHKKICYLEELCRQIAFPKFS